MTNEITYKISDTKYGTKAIVTLPEGTFNLTLTYRKGMNNRREWVVNGNYPEAKYLISYDGGSLFILKKGGEFTIGQKLTHKALGKGVVTNVNGNIVAVDFGKKGQKVMMKSILKNFLK